MARLSKEELFTRFAREANDLSTEFVKAFGGTRLGAYAPDLHAPDSVSTNDGAQAHQSLRLLSRDPQLQPIVCGTLKVREHEVELRDFERLSALHTGRHGEELPFERALYESFLGAAERWFGEQGFKVIRLGVTPSVMPPAKPTRSPIPLVFGLVLLVAAIAAFVLLRR